MSQHAPAATVLVTGGAGYIGSHTTLALLDAGYRCIVLDNLSTGVRELAPAAAEFVEGDIADRALVDKVLRDRRVTAILHFAGSVVVPDSVRDPLGYYANNTLASHGLIAAAIAAGVRGFVFSSTAAIYGEGEGVPVDEDAPARPINPYGWSKLMTEQIIRDAAAAHGLPYAILRYFNVAGADPDLRSGQATPNATHLIKVACEAALGRRSGLTIFGDDFDTPDGTGVRDYIHVSDLARAHVLALDRLLAQGGGLTLNCGYGRGYSVREVLAAVAAESGGAVNAAVGPRRAGDPGMLISRADRIRAALDWRPSHDDLPGIVRSALAWERKWAARAG